MPAKQREFKGSAGASPDTGALLWRILVDLLFLVIAFAAALVFLMAIGFVDYGSVPRFGDVVIGFLGDEESFRARWLLLLSGSPLVGIGAVHILLRGYGRGRTKPRKVVVSAAEDGLVVVDPKGICLIAAEPVLKIPGVLDVKASTIEKADAPIRLKLHVTVSAAAELKKVGDEACSVSAAAVEKLDGI
ncbi:MAG: hypothetical protein HN348_13040, partial [Proteobacteria bacterium]|nr:hypothetical protein [Pseudomonadota bacterium]